MSATGLFSLSESIKLLQTSEKVRPVA